MLVDGREMLELCVYEIIDYIINHSASIMAKNNNKQRKKT